MKSNNFRRRSCTMRLMAISWSGILMLAVASGWFSSQRIGTVAWGPTDDIRSIAIAISAIKFDLAGAVGYRAVMQKIADNMTGLKSDLNVGDEVTRRMVGDPTIVTAAIQAGAAVTRGEIKPDYITELAEDVGYARFYELAFRIFGFNAYSTYFLYLSIWFLSSVGFVFAYYRENLAIATFSIANSALFVLTASPTVFDYGRTSLSSGRFVWTLALIPMLHIVLAVLSTRRLARFEVVLNLLQCLVAFVAISARSSGQWCIIAIVFLGISIFTINRHQFLPMLVDFYVHLGLLFERTKSFAFFSRCVIVGRGVLSNLTRLPRSVIMTVLVLCAISAGNTIEKISLNELYFTDDYIPHHFIWHSAFLGLAIHPDWPKEKPFAELPDYLSDSMAFQSFEIVMKRRGLPYISAQGLHKLRLHERVIRELYIDFALNHPKYMLELLLFYKLPQFLFIDVSRMINWIGWTVMGITILLCAILLALQREMSVLRGSWIGLPIILGSSLLPGLWAYPVIDQTWGIIFVTQATLALLIGFYIRDRFITPISS